MTDERNDRRDDERFEAFLERHAGDYNRPPETPRETMWEAIDAARRERDRSDDGAAIPISSRRRTRWAAWAVATAAVLVLGIALGRLTTERGGAPPTDAGPTMATAPDSVDEAGEPVDPAPSTTDQLASDARDEDAPGSGTRVAAADARDPAPARRARDGREDEGESRRPAAETGSRDLYRLASTQMLEQAETILVQYRAGRRSAGIDPAIGRWAKDALSSTRLLLDSPAGDDARMRSLLEDLELVLAQILHVAGAGEPGDEAEWLDRTIEDRDMIPRLRMAIPEGSATVGL